MFKAAFCIYSISDAKHPDKIQYMHLSQNELYYSWVTKVCWVQVSFPCHKASYLLTQQC